MTQGPDEQFPAGHEPTTPLPQPPAEQPLGQSWGQPAQQPMGQPMPPPPPAAAPYGVHPVTGVPYSEKSKLIAGLLQILIPLGIGRIYMGDSKTGVIQLVVTLVTCGLGAVWPFVDGILILVGDPVDEYGRPLRS